MATVTSHRPAGLINRLRCSRTCRTLPLRLKNLSSVVDRQIVTGEYSDTSPEDAQKGFSIVRKGYDPAEVQECLAEYEEAFRDLEEHAARLRQELSEARLEVEQLKAAEAHSIDQAMAAVFAAKDRIIKAATERARRIEEEAKVAAGLPPRDTQPVEHTPSIADVGVELAAELEGAEAESPAEPNAVLAQMLREADEIRDRLDDGLAAAFDQMEQMQRDAEVRARELLAAARLEAARLRSAGGDDEVAIEVTLTDGERPSRYSRQSAALPRLTSDRGESILSEMADLRARFRGGDDAVPSQDAAG